MKEVLNRCDVTAFTKQFEGRTEVELDYLAGVMDYPELRRREWESLSTSLLADSITVPLAIDWYLGCKKYYISNGWVRHFRSICLPISLLARTSEGLLDLLVELVMLGDEKLPTFAHEDRLVRKACFEYGFQGLKDMFTDPSMPARWDKSDRPLRGNYRALDFTEVGVEPQVQYIKTASIIASTLGEAPCYTLARLMVQNRAVTREGLERYWISLDTHFRIDHHCEAEEAARGAKQDVALNAFALAIIGHAGPAELLDRYTDAGLAIPEVK